MDSCFTIITQMMLACAHKQSCASKGKTPVNRNDDAWKETRMIFLFIDLFKNTYSFTIYTQGSHCHRKPGIIKDFLNVMVCKCH